MAKDEKKPLLNESTVRRFMKLAEIDKLSQGFVTDLYEFGEPGLEDEEGDLPPEGEELPPEEPEGPVEEVPLGDEELAGEELPPAPPEGGIGEEELNQFVEDVIVGLKDSAAQLGVDVDVEGAAAAAGADEGDLGDLGGLGGEEELGLPPEEPGLEGEEEPGLEGEEELPPGNRAYMEEGEELPEVVDDEALINEVAKRVAARLIRASKKAKKEE